MKKGPTFCLVGLRELRYHNKNTYTDIQTSWYIGKNNVTVPVRMSNKHNDNFIDNVNEKTKIITEEKSKILLKKNQR